MIIVPSKTSQQQQKNLSHLQNSTTLSVEPTIPKEEQASMSIHKSISIAKDNRSNLNNPNHVDNETREKQGHLINAATNEAKNLKLNTETQSNAKPPLKAKDQPSIVPVEIPLKIDNETSKNILESTENKAAVANGSHQINLTKATASTPKLDLNSIST